MLISPKQVKITYESCGIELNTVTTNFVPQANDIVEFDGQRYHVKQTILRVKKTVSHIIVQCAAIV